jgi:DNA-3-methyladenine glycosylase
MDIGQALPASFYECDKHELATQLLGRTLVRRFDGQLLAGRIVEVEVYGGSHDPASHANTGQPTDRTEAMFGAPGNAYIYQIYGLYHCLNVVAPAQEKAAAILIRALEPLNGRETMARHRELDDKFDGDMPRSVERNLLSGPGKLCQAMRIGTELDGTPLRDGPLWIAPGRPLVETEHRDAIETTGRIGLNRDTCGESVDWPWRYVDSRSDFLSR